METTETRPTTTELQLAGPGKSLPWYPLLACVVTGLSLLLYGQIFHQPFVQDDWMIFYRMRTMPLTEIIGQAFFPTGNIFYRPLGMVYFLLMYNLFGIAPFPFHLVALLFHIANAVLAAAIIDQITGRKDIAFGGAILYTVATTVHADPLLWMVGFYDLAGVCCFFLSILFYLRQRSLLSAGAFLLALLAKEAPLPLALILLCHALIMDRSKLRLLIPHGLVLVVYVIVRWLSVGSVEVDPSHPYRAELLGPHVLTNLSYFAQWAFEVLFPGWSPSLAVVLELGAFAAVLAAISIVLRKYAVDRKRRVQTVFFVLWAVLAITPVLVLKQHAYRYYLAYSLVPVLTLLVFYVEGILPRQVHRYFFAVLTLLVVANAAANWFSLQSKFAAEPTTVPVFDGSNHLIRKGTAVRTVQAALMTRYPSLPPGARIILAGVDVTAFFKDTGPRVWYRDDGIEVYTPAEYDSLCNRGFVDTSHSYFLTFGNDTLSH